MTETMRSMDQTGVMGWVAEYERAWRGRDLDGVARLFTEDAEYRQSPYEPPRVGHAPIREFWPEDEGVEFTMTAEPEAVDNDRAVVRVEVQYLAPKRQEYRDLWVLRFADDGRVEFFEEWPYWPGRSFSAADERGTG